MYSFKLPVCVICISQNLFTCDLRSGRSCDLYIIGLWKNNEICPASSKRVKTAQFSQDYVMPIWLPSYRWLHLLVVGGDWSTEASQFKYSADARHLLYP